jgi:WXG100 family type VII secretion target
MAGFSATPEQLQQAAQSMEEKNQALQQVLNQFLSGAEGISGAWSGAASMAFQNLARRFKDDSDKLNQALMQMSEQMTGTSKAYAQQEQANQDAMSNISNALGG